MRQDIQLRVNPQTAAIPTLLKARIVEEFGIQSSIIQDIKILKKSIDARQKQVYINLMLRLYINEPAPQQEYESIQYPDVSNCPQAIIVGAGPAGLFAALRLLELHIRPIILERGKDVHTRRKDIALISRQHKINPESNYSFGEGGAGAFSDGKLYTRSIKRGNTYKILSIFCQHGASTSILSDAHPHIGTDKLPKVIENIRHTILFHGGEIHFETCASQLLIDRKNTIQGIHTTNGETFKGPVILATGHSARDVYQFLYQQNISLEEKGLAIGVRIEHPSHLIDSIMYHSKNGRGKYLPAAEYHMSTQVKGRGVYSFCMCPGGFIVPAASNSTQIVVNGMSPSTRNSLWSNSGMVVEVHPEDLKEQSIHDFILQIGKDETFQKNYPNFSQPHSPLNMMFLQEALEYECWRQGNYRQTAPCQLLTDFINNHIGNRELPATSYSPGVTQSPLHFLIPRFFTSRLQAAFKQFGKQYHGFLTSEASLLGIETRTSSPIRIPRDKEKLSHISSPGLYPCGEGAGYAGGIVSAAIDGERCAEALASLYC